jgi:hypothetical protein|tara:strand:+ start:2074 stop:2511 length:438 start_codon:yes stop_codon:yes gene_type:complete
MNIKEKLNILQTKLHVPKGQFNKFGNYKYRSLEDITLAIKAPLEELKCILLMQSVIEEIGGKNYVKATVTLADCESDESISVTAYAREATESKGMSPAQMTGSSDSYAKKYALGGLLNLDESQDDDATNTHGKTISNTKPRKDII